MITTYYKVYIGSPLSDEEKEVLESKATMHGAFNVVTSVNIVTFNMSEEYASYAQVIKDIAKWFDRIGGAEDIVKVQMITDFETNYVTDEIKALLGIKNDA